MIFRGRPRKRWKDCAKDYLKSINIDHNSWYRESQRSCEMENDSTNTLNDATRSDKTFAPPLSNLTGIGERERERERERTVLCIAR